jgi:hypothetical protein
MADLVKIYDHATGEEIEREMTAGEQAVRDKEVEEWLKAIAIKDADKAAKSASKAALLDRLGITAEEATLLLG